MSSRTKTLVLEVLAVLLVSLATLTAMADIVVYDNGPIAGENGLGIVGGYELTNSFSVSAPTSLTAAQNIGLWVQLGDAAPTQVQWKIGTVAFGSDISAGISTVSTALLDLDTYATNGRYDVYASAINLHGVVAANTTYWLTLHGAINPTPGVIYWDLSSGPSTAFHYIGIATSPIPSESFQLVGNAIPESSRIGLVACVITILCACGRRLGLQSWAAASA